MALRTEQKLKTRRKLIESALNLSAQNGFAALSLREVAKAAGITPAAFYRHFHDLNDLGLALVDEIGLGLRQLLREARRNVLAKGGSTVSTSVETFIKYITENENLFRVLQGERQGSSIAFRKALFAEISRFVEEIADALEKGPRPVPEAALAAEAIVALTFTIGAEALDLPKHRRQELIERLIKQVNMILRGAGAGIPPKR